MISKLPFKEGAVNTDSSHIGSTFQVLVRAGTIGGPELVKTTSAITHIKGIFRMT